MVDPQQPQMPQRAPAYGRPPALNPYGMQHAAPPLPQRGLPEGFKGFAISYLVIRGLLLGLALLAVLYLSFQSTELYGGDELRLIAVIFSGVLLIWLAYAVAGGILALKGKLAGPIMGMIDAGGCILLGMASIGLEAVSGGRGANIFAPGCGMVINGIIVLTAWSALRGWRTRKVEQQLQADRLNRHAVMAAQGFDLPLQSPLRPPVARQPLAGGHAVPARVTRPEAVIRLIGGAVGADGNPSEARLQRARDGALRALGGRYATQVDKSLATAPAVDNLQEYIAPLARMLRAVPDPRLFQAILAAAREVVTEDGTVDPLAEEYLEALAQALAPAGR
jgi:hypothetical protein